MRGPGPRVRGGAAAILIGASVVLAVALGVRQTFGLFLKPASVDLGLGREAFALMIAVQNMVWGLAQPVAGAIADRFGPARVVAAGGVFYAAGLAVMSGAAGPTALHLGGGLLVGLGLSGASFAVLLGAVGRTAAPSSAAWRSGW